MYFLLSGEGKGDIGVCDPISETCNTEFFKPGPMTLIIDKLVESFLGYDFSHIDTERVSFVSESYLADQKQPPVKKAMSLRGKKQPSETKYYFENARALAVAAKNMAVEHADEVVAVLFRDSDGTASAGRGNWRDKRESMINGFKAEGFENGVPMVPKPKSEAWLLCAVKDNPYQSCEKLEDQSGNDKAVNPLKDQLSVALNGSSSTQVHNNLITDGDVDIHRIDMPSYNEFKQDLETVIKSVVGGRA